MRDVVARVAPGAPLAPAQGVRPDRGIGHYLRDLVYGSIDGVVTTVAVIAGAAGAKLDPMVGLVLGAANLSADGLSMAVSNYLGLKSELEQNQSSVEAEQPIRHALATFASFVVVGAVPLLAYALPGRRLGTALVLAIVALAVVGGARARFVGRTVVRCALEMVALGVAAIAVAYLTGLAVEHALR
jgi:VIT1/CCC1 family predicted Fe2+/Mn2+ transporter